MAKRGNPLLKKTTPAEPEVLGEGAEIIPLNETFPGEQPMSVREKKRLVELEAVVTTNFKAFYEVGCAIREIRDTRLYRETHKSFSDYAKEMWDMQYAHAKRMIQAADVIDRLLPYTEEIKNGSNWSQNENVRNCAQEPLPQNEAQARALAKYHEKKQIEIWKKAVETADGRITAAHIKNTARQIHGKIVKDKIRKTRQRTESPDAKMSDRFRAAFSELLDAINEERLNDWKNTDRDEVLRHLEGLMQAVAQPL